MVGCQGTTVCVCARLCATLRSGDRYHYYHLVLFVVFLFFCFSFFQLREGQCFCGKQSRDVNELNLSSIILGVSLQFASYCVRGKYKMVTRLNCYNLSLAIDTGSHLKKKVSEFSRFLDIMISSIQLRCTRTHQTQVYKHRWWINKPVELMATQLEHVWHRNGHLFYFYLFICCNKVALNV